METEAEQSVEVNEQPWNAVELDRALSPIRRTVQWVLAEPGRIGRLKHAEATLSPWVLRALEQPLPEALKESLVTVAGLLGGLDALDEGERLSRLEDVSARVARLDAVVGLPLSVRPKRRRRPVIPANRPEESEQTSDEQPDTASAASGDGSTPAPRSSGAESSRKQERSSRSRPRRNRAENKRAEAKQRVPSGPAAWTLGSEGDSLAKVLPASLAERFEAVGLEKIGDLLLAMPVDVEVVRPIVGAGRPAEAGRRAMGGRVRSRATVCHPDGTTRTEVVLHGAGPVVAQWSAVPWQLLNILPVDARGVLVGEFTPGEPGVLLEPVWAVDDGKKAARVARYGLDGISDRELRDALLWTLPWIQQLRDPLPVGVLDSLGLPKLGDAVFDLHFRTQCTPAPRRRLALNEALGHWIHRSRGRYGSQRRGVAQVLPHAAIGRAFEVLDEPEEDAIQLALEPVKRDLVRSAPMMRLLMGDSGSGKHMVALLAAVQVADGKGQVVFQLPDPVSAETRFMFAEPILRELGFVARLIHGAPSEGQRDAIKRGDVHVLFGTSLVEQGIEFRRLGLVVAEEYEDAGSTAAAVAEMSGAAPDMLVLARAQVPAEVLLHAYATHDITMVNAVRRAETQVTVLPASQRAVAYASAATVLEAGQQAMISFPLVNGRDALNADELARVRQALDSDAFPGSRVSILHGGMSRDEQHATWDGFRRHRADVLVATVPVELGQSIPRAGVLIVEQADRMDPIRLHRACRHLSLSLVDKVRVFFITGDAADAGGRLRAERVAGRGNELQLVRELREGHLPDPPQTRFLDFQLDRELLLQAQSLVHESFRRKGGWRDSPLAAVLPDIEHAWSVLFPDDPLSLPKVQGGGRRKRRRRRRKRS